MKRLLGWVGALVALVLLAVVADRVAVRAAENGAVQAFEQQADDVAGARLDITGFPFLTQLARGELAHVTGSADSASFAGYAVSDLRIDAHGVSTSAPYRLASGTASGLLATGSLEQALRDQSRLAVDVGTQDGTLTLALDVLGLEVVVAGRPRVDGPRTLGVDVTSVTAGPGVVSVDDLPGPVADLLTDLRVELDLPAGVALDDVQVADGAVRVALTGTDVDLETLVDS
jgi:hypothetical protein